MAKQVVIVGGGFAGISAAKKLASANFSVTIIDKTNHHLFQPLLYQVATAALSPGDIAMPIRAIFSKQKKGCRQLYPFFCLITYFHPHARQICCVSPPNKKVFSAYLWG